MKLKKEKKINIIHNIYSIDKSIGGPIFSMSVLAEAQARLGHNVTVISSQSKNHNNPVNFYEKINLILLPCFTKYKYMTNWTTSILNLNEMPDVIHTYGIWTYHNYIAYKFSLKYDIPHILAPCGMLYKEGMGKSYFTKKIAWEIFQKRVLQNISCFHAKSDQEISNIFSVFSNLNIEKIPNPLPSVNQAHLLEENLTFEKHIKNKNILLYIGRLVKRKGIKDLISAWDKLMLKKSDWVLLIVGDDENKGFLNDILKQIENCNNINCINLNSIKNIKNNPNLIITGSLYGDSKAQVYKKSNLFINPSNFENFGMTIAEALNYNLPVIISKNTPWKQVEKLKCGWHLEENNLNLYKILNKALKMTKSELKKMGRNSSDLTKDFNSSNIAKKALSLYLKYIV